MRLQGQTFNAAIIERIKTTLRENPETTRSGLSRTVCGWLDWRSANGNLCDSFSTVVFAIFFIINRLQAQQSRVALHINHLAFSL